MEPESLLVPRLLFSKKKGSCHMSRRTQEIGVELDLQRGQRSEQPKFSWNRFTERIGGQISAHNKKRVQFVKVCEREREGERKRRGITVYSVKSKVQVEWQ